MKIVKTFGDKKILFRNLQISDIRRAKDFQDYINSLIKEDAQILFTKKIGLKEEKLFIKTNLDKIKKHKRVYIIAEHNKKIIGNTGIELRMGREEHNGVLGIGIRNDYREIGIGKFFMGEILKLAKKELSPAPKIIRLSVLPTNKPAIGLYKKYGFKEVARIPKQIKYKGKLIDEIIMIRKV